MDETISIYIYVFTYNLCTCKRVDVYIYQLRFQINLLKKNLLIDAYTHRLIYASTDNPIYTFTYKHKGSFIHIQIYAHTR